MNRISVTLYSSVFSLKYTHTARFIFLALCLLGGCGRRGSLEPPLVQPADSSKDKKSQNLDLSDTASFKFTKSSAHVPLQAPNTSFFLDRLLSSKTEFPSKNP